MTDKLAELIRHEFPDSNIDVYEANERLYVSIPDKSLLDLPVFSDRLTVEDIVGSTLKGTGYSFYPNGTGDIKNPLITFEPVKQELSKYHGHSIEVHMDERFPTLTFSTGNRGNASLEEDQRIKYLDFLRQLHKAYINR